MHVFKNFILNTKIEGLINAFLVHYYILQINKQNKFNMRMYISCYSFLFANDQTIKKNVMLEFLNKSLSHT